MDSRDSKIFLTDKNGRREEKTSEIKHLSYDEKRKRWKVVFIGSSKVFSYQEEKVQIIKNCLSDKRSAGIFDYLLHLARFSEIKNEEGQNLLVRHLEKSHFIDERSALARYLNPQKFSAEVKNPPALIFPFGCNNSQFQAVKTALSHPISIIQGPPGTGKTQTILNLIANLLMQDKSILIVSNNNVATANIYEKLNSEKYALGFLCVVHGKRQNMEDFLKNQQKTYPSCLKKWREILPSPQAVLDEEIWRLQGYFQAMEKISELKVQLDSLAVERQYFEAHDIYPSKKKIPAQKVMELLQKIQFKYGEKERLGFFTKWSVRLRLGLGWSCRIEPEKLIRTLRALYYLFQTKELEEELSQNQAFIQHFNPSKVYEKCLEALRNSLAKRYLKNPERPQFKDRKEIYFNPEAFVREYPVILSTTFSSRATIGAGGDFLYDYVIMDEASQVDIVTGALALSCGRNAIIVGDKMQLPNVVEEQKKPIIQRLFHQAKLPEGYHFVHSFLVSLEKILPDVPQTLLREHYRCHPKIINFCNQQFYGGKLLIMTEDKGERDVLEAIKTIPGNFCKDRYNQRQIDVIKNEILPKYSPYEINHLGIITPYNNQADAISSQIPKVDAATVHKYQGREREVIIISTVDNTITSFCDDANMLNVAISRAKKKLAVVLSGNKQPEHSNLMALLKYIQYHNFAIRESKVRSIFDFFYTKQTEAKFQFLKNARKISKFDSENAMSQLLSELFKEPDYLKYSFVFELPLKDVVSEVCLQTLPAELAEYVNCSWSHVDFAIFNKVTKEIVFGIEVDGYNYHKRGSRQAQRDRKKNAIFELISLPLLRLSTKGSNEEAKIRAILNHLENKGQILR